MKITTHGGTTDAADNPEGIVPFVSPSGSAASSERKLFLIKVIRHWHSKASEHAENGFIYKSTTATAKAEEALCLLENICRTDALCD